MSAPYDLSEDLEFRSDVERVRILYCSGPRPGRVDFVASRLPGLSEQRVQEIIDEHGFVAPPPPSWYRGS